MYALDFILQIYAGNANVWILTVFKYKKQELLHAYKNVNTFVQRYFSMHI